MNGFKPCPFCGCEEFRLSDKEFFEEKVAEQGSFCVAVRCKHCFVEMYVHEESDWSQAIRDLRWKWNRREQI